MDGKHKIVNATYYGLTMMQCNVLQEFWESKCLSIPMMVGDFSIKYNLNCNLHHSTKCLNTAFKCIGIYDQLYNPVYF